MKNLLILLILFTAFLTSCQTKAENLVTNLNTNSIENTAKTEEPKSLNSPTPIPKSVKEIDLKVGIVDVTDDKTICFRTKNANLTEKTPVSIVTSIYEPPQKVLEATIERKLEKSCVSKDSDAGENNPEEDSYYSLALTDKKIDKSEIDVSIGIIQPAGKIQMQNKLASIDLDNDGKPEFFRQCGSSEGLHLTIWTGKPLKGKRIWHYYYYLHYEIVPDCKKKDWEGTDD
jgi:hypothetical protein